MKDKDKLIIKIVAVIMLLETAALIIFDMGIIYKGFILGGIFICICVVIYMVKDYIKTLDAINDKTEEEDEDEDDFDLELMEIQLEAERKKYELLKERRKSYSGNNKKNTAGKRLAASKQTEK